MKTRSWLCLLLAVGLLLTVGTAEAQNEAPSDALHRFIEPSSDYPFDEDGLRARVLGFNQHRDDERNLNDLMQYIRNNPQLLKSVDPAAIETLRRDPRFQDARFKNPEYRKEFSKAVAKSGLSSDQKEALEKAVAEPGSTPGTPQGSFPGQHLHPKSFGDEAREHGRSRSHSSRSRNADWLNAQAAQRLTSLVQMIDRDGGMRDSERLREVVKRLTSGDTRFDWRDPTGLDLAGGLGRVGKYLSGERSSPVDRLPSTPEVHMPSSHSWSSPSFGSSASPGSGMTLLWLLVGVLVLVILWQFGMTQLRSRARTPVSWKLGPWPVDPSQIASRGDLVKAFEYLACLLLGPESLHRNHRDLAGRLAAIRPSPACQAAAAELSLLYEQARYAPPDEPLSETCMAGARRDLSLLAEASA